jgi:hypothetical protein
MKAKPHHKQPRNDDQEGPSRRVAITLRRFVAPLHSFDNPSVFTIKLAPDAPSSNRPTAQFFRRGKRNGKKQRQWQRQKQIPFEDDKTRKARAKATATAKYEFFAALRMTSGGVGI